MSSISSPYRYDENTFYVFHSNRSVTLMCQSVGITRLMTFRLVFTSIQQTSLTSHEFYRRRHPRALAFVSFRSCLSYSTCRRSNLTNFIGWRVVQCDALFQFVDLLFVGLHEECFLIVRLQTVRRGMESSLSRSLDLRATVSSTDRSLRSTARRCSLADEVYRSIDWCFLSSLRPFD